MIKHLLTILLIYQALHGISQKNPNISNSEHPGILEVITVLPNEVDETSGIVFYGDNILTFNDSGGKPVIYEINPKNGDIIKEIRLQNATNIDWEDIAEDKDFIYVGDFGNNKGNRKDLVIYKIAKKDIVKGKKISIVAEKIKFSYSDQKKFEPSKLKTNFDCEALIVYGDSLLLFSKDWSDKHTRLYKLPKSPGEYIISPRAELNIDILVTGAGFNKNSGNLALIGYKDFVSYAVLINNFNGDNFDNTTIHRIKFPDMKNAQTEGIAWFNDKEVFISAEATKAFEQSLFKFNLIDACMSTATQNK